MEFRRLLLILPYFVTTQVGVVSVNAAQKEITSAPFWERKPEVMKRVLDDRAIVVSAKVDTLQVAGRRREQKLEVLGTGVVSAPRSFSFRTAQNYQRLKELSSHFKTVQFDPSSQKLHLVAEAAGFQARMIMRIRPERLGEDDMLRFEVIWGDLRGMTGLIRFRSVEARRTQISIEAKHQTEEVQFPKALVSLALETIVQKVAERMRSTIEADFRAESKPMAGKSAGSAPK